MSPAVTIIMPAYNAARTIESSVRSALAQTRADFELIIIDDCSTDGTNAIIARCVAGDPRIKPLRNERNKGVAFSRNLGVQQAAGKWVAFLDSDDLWHPDKLKSQLEFMEYVNAPISYTASAFIDETGRRYKYIMPAEFEINAFDLLKHNLMSCSSVIVRRDIMARHQMRDGAIHEDFAAWLDILRSESLNAYGLDKPLLVYRLSKHSKSSVRIKSALMMLRTLLAAGFALTPALLYTGRYAVHSVVKRFKIMSGGFDNHR
ncbi:MAG: glycosyltransferase family 2 protein [Clostridiales bacterium]|jgi:teichuronic acid biosynthesis glycosyltransferase TuaG|nr:glycosyltransferase family 2 protein [Clostridiales bacterium]